MDTEPLVETLLADGQRLVEYLPVHGFAVAAAIWLKASTNGRWHFYLVPLGVDDAGITKAYQFLYTLTLKMPGLVAIDPLEIRLLGTDDPIAKDILAIRTHARGPSPVRWRGRSLGDLIIEDAYVYQPSAVAA